MRRIGRWRTRLPHTATPLPREHFDSSKNYLLRFTSKLSAERRRRRQTRPCHRRSNKLSFGAFGLTLLLRGSRSKSARPDDRGMRASYGIMARASNNITFGSCKVCRGLLDVVPPPLAQTENQLYTLLGHSGSRILHGLGEPSKLYNYSWGSSSLNLSNKSKSCTRSGAKLCRAN